MCLFWRGDVKAIYPEYGYKVYEVVPSSRVLCGVYHNQTYRIGDVVVAEDLPRDQRRGCIYNGSMSTDDVVGIHISLSLEDIQNWAAIHCCPNHKIIKAKFKDVRAAGITLFDDKNQTLIVGEITLIEEV